MRIPEEPMVFGQVGQTDHNTAFLIRICRVQFGHMYKELVELSNEWNKTFH